MSFLSQCSLVIVIWGISAPGYVKEVVYGLNAIYKRYIYQLMSTVQLLGFKTFDSHILMHSCKENNDFSLAKQLQKYLFNEHSKHVVLNQEKYRKIASKIKWTDREYHVQYNANVAHKDVKIYCDTNQFSTLPFFVHIQSLMEQ